MGLKMLEVLSENELKRIHEASLRGLSETGMKIRSRKALELLGDSRASVDPERQLVKIPEEMVEDALQSLPILKLGENRGRSWLSAPLYYFSSGVDAHRVPRSRSRRKLSFWQAWGS